MRTGRSPRKAPGTTIVPVTRESAARRQLTSNIHLDAAMSEQMTSTTPTSTPPPKRRRRRPLRILGLLAGLLAVLIAAPSIEAGTGLRDGAIDTIVASPSVAASTDGASFGW